MATSTEVGHEEVEPAGGIGLTVHGHGRHPSMHKHRGSVAPGRVGRDGVQEFAPHLSCCSPSDISAQDVDIEPAGRRAYCVRRIEPNSEYLSGSLLDGAPGRLPPDNSLRVICCASCSSWRSSLCRNKAPLDENSVV